jgi:hypothetical protein
MPDPPGGRTRSWALPPAAAADSVGYFEAMGARTHARRLGRRGDGAGIGLITLLFISRETILLASSRCCSSAARDPAIAPLIIAARNRAGLSPAMRIASSKSMDVIPLTMGDSLGVCRDSPKSRFLRDGSRDRRRPWRRRSAPAS